MNALAALMLVSAAVMEVWTESPMTRVFPDSTRPRVTVNSEPRIYAAKGEFESIQICIRAGDAGLQNVRITAAAPDNSFPVPILRRVAYVTLDAPSPRASGPRDLWPDRLLDYAPFSIPPNENATTWVTYAIPRDAPPGLRTVSISVEADPVSSRKRATKIVIPLKITVFDFIIPTTPSLRTAFPLDRVAIRTFYSIDDANIEAWKPIYDALASYRISFRIWDGSDGLVTFRDRVFDAANLKAHLDYAVKAAHMNSIDVGGGPGGLALFPEPDKTDPTQDPLQTYLRSVAPWLNDVKPGAVLPKDPLQPFLNDIANWLEKRNWLDRAYIEPVVLPERALWQNVRDTAFRVRIHENRIPRLLVADVHPFFERYTHIWAMPLCRYDPHADERLRQGISLLDIKNSPAKSVTSSSSGPLPQQAGVHEAYDTLCAEACDGSVFTYWVSKNTPSPGHPEWLEIALKVPISTSEVKIVWKSGYEAADINLFALRAGFPPLRIPFKWEERSPVVAYGQSWAVGTLPSPQAFTGLRIEFPASCNGGPVAVSEVILGSAYMEVSDPFDPVEPWLFAHDDDFPSFHVDARTAEFRLAPWVCFAQRMRGFLHHGLNQWPPEWADATDDARNPLPFNSPGFTGNATLFYPGPKGPLPSIRAELLRDGLEDYEYLRLLEKAVREKKIDDPQLAQMTRPEIYSATVSADFLDDTAKSMQKQRVNLGWALSKPERSTRPQPKGSR